MTPGAGGRQRLTLDERDDLATFLNDLDPVTWDAATLCPGWTARDILAHLVAWDDLLLHRTRLDSVAAAGRWGTAMARAWLDTNRLNDRVVADASRRSPTELLSQFNSQASDQPRWLFDRVAPGAQLAEYLVHHQDIRRPLGAHRQIPDDRLSAALDGIKHVPGVGARSMLRQRRWVATDVDWSAGRGLEVHAPGEAILLTLAGRSVPEVN